MTEKELREEIARLEKTINAGDATVSVANRLDELRRAQQRIRQVRNRGAGAW
jgi:hypothetical protein